MTRSISSLLSSRQAMTKHFTFLSRGLGSALYRQYARRQCLLCLSEMLLLDDATLAGLGTTRRILADLQARLMAGGLPLEPFPAGASRPGPETAVRLAA
jgi:hypothetical protein